MRLLLDTNILIEFSSDQSRRIDSRMLSAIKASENECLATVMSLWEIALKTRTRKLATSFSTIQVVAHFDAIGIEFLPITRDHVLAELEHEPSTRDPFDRLLLAICQVEGMRLVTLDRALAAHPLAWK